MNDATQKKPGGFASMDPQRQREIASLGGRAAHQKGTAPEFTSEQARAAAKKRHADTRARKAVGEQGETR